MLCARYRIDNSKRVQHTALIDCELLAKVYINLTDQKEPTLNFQKQEDQSVIPEKVISFTFKKNSTDSRRIKKTQTIFKTGFKKKIF